MLNQTAKTIGYQAVAHNGFGTTVQLQSTGKILKVDKNLIYFKFDTYPGQSGSPILDNNNNVVGIFNYGAYNNVNDAPDSHPDYNMARKITADIKSWLLS